MANPWPDQNGTMPTIRQQPQPHPQPPQPPMQNRAERPFTIAEALPYTPFTSVLPFEPDIINNPTIGSGPLAPSVAELVSHEDYDALNQEAANPNQSKRLESSLEYVQNLLKPGKITEYQFKTAPRPGWSPPKSPPKSDAAPTSISDGLSPFARMVYDNTAISFRYPTPDTPKPAALGGNNMAPRLTKPSPTMRKAEPPKIVKHNPASQLAAAQAAAKQKALIEIHLPSVKSLNIADYQTVPDLDTQPQTVSPAGLAAPQPKTEPTPLATKSEVPVELTTQSQALLSTQPVSATEEHKPGILIELPAAHFNRDEYVYVEDTPDAPAHLSKKRRRAELEDDDLLDGGPNNRERANAALGDLQKCLQEIFEAEDKFSAQNGSSNHWITLTADQEPMMTTTALFKVQKLLAKTLELGCFRLVPADDLRRVQALCDGALKHAQGLDFRVEKSWGEVEVGLWVQQLPEVEAGLRAARTALTVMSGNREEKQLYSEDLIQQGLDLFKSVMDGIIFPVAEVRNSNAKEKELFKHLTAQRKIIGTVLTASQKLFGLMSQLATSIDLSDTVISTLEFASTQMIFIEHAPTESNSVVHIQKFDGLRLIAMDMLSQIFVKNPPLRQGIFDDVLSSIEKLPSGKQNARQFKLTDGGSIQPVSALIMRLVQASADKIDDHKEKSRGRMIQALEDADDGEPKEKKPKVESFYTIKSEEIAAVEHETAIQELQSVAPPLFDTAQRNAAYVVNHIVKKAQQSSKSADAKGDVPYRNLLDLFVEDFTTCLDSPDWPAAELLLRLLMYMMLNLIKSDKHVAVAKNMALELLGVMAAAISKLRSHVRKTAANFEGSNADELGQWLAELTSMALSRKFSSENMTSWLGPYRVILEHLESKVKDDLHLRSAISFVVTTWGVDLVKAYDSEDRDETEETDAEFGRMGYRLRNMIEDRRWLTNEYSFKTVSVNHAKLSHSILLLRSPFCDYFKGILNILMQSMTTDAATVRSKSLKSINQVLETDPTILEGDSVVVQLILQCSSDSSPQVRDSALGLIAKCISMRPDLEAQMTPTIIDRLVDSGVGVRKRAMKLARDIYLANQSKKARSAIILGLLNRMQDPEEGVRELARQVVEEVWIAPFYKADDTTAYKQSLTDHVALMVQTVKQGNAALILDKVFQTILSPASKLAKANFEVCKRLVASMFDLVNNPDSDDPAVPSGKDALQVLMIFARADPKLFTFEQIRLLKPRLASMGQNEDGLTSKAVVVIYRRVLPDIPTVHSQFLSEIKMDLMKAVTSLGRLVLDDVFACLWIISRLTENSENVARLVFSSLQGIQKLRALMAKGPLGANHIRMLDRYSLIVGMAGKNCDLDGHEEFFKTGFPKWQGKSVSKLMVDVLVPIASPSQQESIRKPALDAIGLICQSKPRNYVAVNVYTTFQQVFDERIPALEHIILRSFKEFLFVEEQRSGQAAAAADGVKEPVKKDLKSMGGTGYDDVASATTQRFLKDITRIALATQDEHAFLAMEVLASISRQGLVHPKETGVTLITLETCPVVKISELAYQEHRALHEKHETVIEREYVKAVHSAYEYSRDVTKDARGATTSPFTPRLHLLVEALKISKAKNRQRFLEKFVGQLDFEPNKLEVKQPMPPHLEYARFLVENLAFLEYMTIGELQSTITRLEKLVTSTGASIAQSIESEVFQIRMEMLAAPMENGEGQPMPSAEAAIDPDRLRQLCAGSMILLAAWEARTHLRRQYGIHSNRRETKAKAAAKDLSKAPNKIPGVTGDKFWEDVARIMTGLDSQELMMETCNNFVELLNVDNEVKVADEEEDGDEEGDEEPTTPDPDEEADAPTSNARGRKRKATGTPGGKAKRVRSSSQPRGRGRPRKKSTPADDDGEDADFA